jgi:hypothetical protein
MAWRIEKSVVRGEIDNTCKGRVTGMLWLAGQPEPIHLDLKGNCLTDLAGCRISFINPSPEPGKTDSFAKKQIGVCGDLTASRKCKIPTIPIEQIKDWNKPIPFKWGNTLYLEWYSEFNGRVVIEAWDWHLETSLPAWRMAPEEEAAQREANVEALKRFMERLQASLEEMDDSDPEQE